MFSSFTSMFGGAALPFQPLKGERGEFRPWQGSLGWEHARGTAPGGPGEAGEVSVSVFKAAVPTGDGPAEELVKNAVKRLKMLKHPHVLSFKADAAVEERGQTVHYVVTEPVAPLHDFLGEMGLEGPQRDQLFGWGLHAVVNAVAFLNNDCKLVHGHVCMASVFVTDSLDWKLGAFDFLTELAELERGVGPLVTGRDRLAPFYCPGEVGKREWGSLKGCPPYAVDSWGIGCFIQELYRGTALSEVGDLRTITGLPKTISKDYQGLLASNPSRRLNPARLLQNSQFFNTKLNDIMEFLDGLMLKDTSEKSRFFSQLKATLRGLPKVLILKKVLPACLKALVYGGAPPSALTPVVQISARMNDEEFMAKHMVPSVSKMFASKDVQMRLNLLQNMGAFSEALTQDIVEKDIFPHLSTSFRDADPMVRDLALRSILSLVPKMEQKTINNSLLQFLANLQKDPEPKIRTNTTVLLSKIYTYMGEASCRRVLANAFTRVLADPYPPVRSAGLLALIETQKVYDFPELARRLIPAVAPLTQDPDPEVKRSAHKCLDSLVAALKNEPGLDEILEAPAPEAAPAAEEQPAVPGPDDGGDEGEGEGWNFTQDLQEALPTETRSSRSSPRSSRRPSETRSSRSSSRSSRRPSDTPPPVFDENDGWDDDEELDLEPVEKPKPKPRRAGHVRLPHGKPSRASGGMKLGAKKMASTPAGDSLMDLLKDD